MNKIFVILPTYNERENIEKLISHLFALPIKDLHVLVVDDNSPDGTGALVDSLKEKYSKLEILHREKKEGLGPAYVAGFQYVLKRGADRIIQMDSDFSHDPASIPTLLEAADLADLVIGSRYIPGGKILHWNIMRRTISRFGNLYAKTILGLRIRDVTGGFKCYRKIALESILASPLGSLGYNFQIETTYRVQKKGFRIVELPIIFTERTVGKSKFSLRIILESFYHILILRLQKNEKNF